MGLSGGIRAFTTQKSRERRTTHTTKLVMKEVEKIQVQVM